MRTPEWKTEEFELLLGHPELSDDALVRLLPGRSEGAIAVVRQGLHAHHQGANASMLSQVMIRRLGAGSVTCPICRTIF